jgi:hypothetical protein
VAERAPQRVTTLPMSEAEYQSRIVDTAFIRGWRLHHCRPLRRADGRHETPITGHKGFPDLILLRGPRLVVLEVKRDGADPTPEQCIWLDAWRAVPGAEVAVAWPCTWPQIERMLR